MILLRYIYRANALITSILLLIPLTGFAQPFFKWVDDRGTVHFADSPEAVPPKYRDRTKKHKLNPDNFFLKTPDTSNKADEKKQTRTVKPVKSSYAIPYISFEGAARRVIVDVMFNKTVSAKMALDTGSPGMIISRELARKIGVFKGSAGHLAIWSAGIGGAAPAIRTVVDSLSFGGLKESFIPTTVTNLKSKAFQGLIGMDIMGQYSVNIQNDRNIVVFTKTGSGKKKRPGGHNKNWWQTNFKEFNHHRKAWKRYERQVEQEIRSRQASGKPGVTELKKVAKEARKQIIEAGKLFKKLDLYASRYAVPMNWREY